MEKFIFLSGIDYGLLVLHPILLFLYVTSILPKKQNNRHKYSLHLIVFLITCALIIPYILLEDNLKIQFLIRSKFNIIAWISTIWINIVYISYLIKLVLLARKFKPNINSNIRNTDLNWLKFLIIGLSTTYVLGSGIGGILCYASIPLYYVNYIEYSGLVIFIFGIGFYGIKQKNIFSIEETTLLKPSTPNKTELVIKKDDELFAQKLKVFMKEEKPYLDENLTLLKLAELLDVKPYYVTFILNKVICKKFHDFINDYRIKEIKTRINNGDLSKFTILSVAYDCGFNSKASFHRIFKLHTGLTPTNYINSLPRS
ncbi:MAG: AraC family transcriptional regulator [Bacteroidales bacterium]|nr:AraC family transcriptional regulator [Bacteroidales bacterium]